MLVAPGALQGFGDLRLAGLDPDVAELGQGGAVALAGDDGPEDLLAGFTDHVGNDLGQLQVHLDQSLLHVLDVAGLVAEEHVPLPRHRAQGTKIALGLKRALQQAEGHQLLQPLAIEHVRFAPGHALDVAGIDQEDGETPRFQQIVEGNPVHPGGFHRHRLDLAGGEPIGQPFEVHGETRKFPHWRVVPIRRHRDVMAGGADVDAGGVGVGHLEKTGVGGHGRLLDMRKEGPCRVGNVVMDHSLKRDAAGVDNPGAHQGRRRLPEPR